MHQPGKHSEHDVILLYNNYEVSWTVAMKKVL
jgi:hypothetical protein